MPATVRHRVTKRKGSVSYSGASRTGKGLARGAGAAVYDHVMSDLSRRPDRTPRRARERRAYQLVVVGGTATAVAVAGLVLALVGVIGNGLWVIAAIVAIAFVVLFRRTVAGR